MRLYLLTFGIIILSFIAEKCRQLVGEESSSKSWTERFTFLNCFDMSYGTLACITKELLKLYLHYIRAVHVHNLRSDVTKSAMKEASKQGKNFEEAIKIAREKGNTAARQASMQVNHVIGPLLSSGWDFFETIYVGGSLLEGIIRGAGTFSGSYVGGIIGEGKIKWVGFLVGSQLGSWVGSIMGLMVYDLAKGVQYLVYLLYGQSKAYPVSIDKEL